MNKNLKRSIEKFAHAHAFLSTPEGSKNRCVDASMWFLEDLGVPKEKMGLHMLDNGPADGTSGEEQSWHSWVKIEGFNIDWTARQYDPNAPFPKIWK